MKHDTQYLFPGAQPALLTAGRVRDGTGSSGGSEEVAGTRTGAVFTGGGLV